MARGPEKPYPPRRLAEAIRLAQAIRDKNAGRPMNRVLLAEALRLSPASSTYRELITSAYRFGLISGSEKSESLTLTPLGEAITAPRSDDELLGSKRGAFRNVPLYQKLLDHFENSRLPEPSFLKNTLEREPFSVNPARSAESAAAFIEDAGEVAFLRDVSGGKWVVLNGGDVEKHVGDAAIEEIAGDDVDAPTEPMNVTAIADRIPEQPTPSTDTPNTQDVKIFIVHGSRKEPLRQLQKILTEFNIPSVTAEDEPHSGRPISQKVADLMRSCTAAVLIFTPDDELFEKDGTPAPRPRQNVVFELGAASLLYGKRIVIFKERSVRFASDFRDLGYIEFDGDNLEAKSLELLRELIGLGAVRLVSAAGA